MKRLPQIVSFLLFIALCASAAYWAMQLFKPPVRPVAAPPRVAQAEIRADAAATLFGARAGNAVAASNYQLRGVIFSGNPRDSVAIISADGKPPQAVRVDAEVVPGVTVTEVHRDHVMISEGGAAKRIDLPESTKGMEGLTEAPVATRPVAPPPPPPPAQPIPSRAQATAAAPAAPSMPPGQPAQQVPPVPGVPQPVQPPVQPYTQPVPGQVPAPQGMTTAPPATVVSPAPGAPGSIVVSPVPPATNVPGAQPVPGVQPTPAR